MADDYEEFQSFRQQNDDDMEMAMYADMEINGGKQEDLDSSDEDSLERNMDMTQNVSQEDLNFDEPTLDIPVVGGLSSVSSKWTTMTNNDLDDFMLDDNHNSVIEDYDIYSRKDFLNDVTNGCGIKTPPTGVELPLI